jgi:signal transduction histidine kinase
MSPGDSNLNSTHKVKAEQGQEAKLSQSLLRRLPEIEANWLERVQKDVVRTHVSLTALRNGMGDYLRGLAESLQEPTGNTEDKGAQAWVSVAREHAITRVQLGFDISQLVHEFIVLRRELFKVICAEGLGSDGPQANRLADLIDSAIAVSVQSYVESRDYEFRRKEAEHIGFITHELRNPLTAVMMCVSVLKKKRLLSAEANTPLEIIETNLRRLQGLIDGVLLAERLEAGQTDVHPIPMSLGSLMAPILDAARMVAQEKHLELKTTFNPDLNLCIDRNLSESVIRNLIDNALKFTDHGTVTIMIEEKDSQNLIFHIRDQCDGISPEELRTIFDPFKRAHTKKPGTGLGLTIARRGVEIQGGEIFSESLPNEGCHFWFTLPKYVHRKQEMKAG